MSLLSVVQDVCAVVGVARPVSVFAAIGSNRTMFEMVALANEMAQRIAYDTRDWQDLQRSVTYPGTGTAADFALPADYKRMLLTMNLWRSTNTMTPMRFIPDPDMWAQRRASNAYYASYGEWTMQGGQILTYPAMGSGVTARYSYLKKNPVSLASGGYGDAFLSDGDTFILGDRLLKLGMIWQWRSGKGSPYAEELGTYTDALAKAQGSDRPAPTYIGRSPISSQNIAYPWMLPS